MPNYLSTDNATFASSTGDWNVFSVGASTQGIARVTSPTPHAGTADLRATAVGDLSNDLRVQLNANVAHPFAGIAAGQTVTFSAWCRFDPANAYAAFSYDVLAELTTFGESGAITARTASVTLTSSGWTQVTLSWTETNPNARAVQIRLRFSATPFTSFRARNGDAFYVSDVSWDGFAGCVENQLQPDDATFDASLGNWYAFDSPFGGDRWTIARVTSPTPPIGSGVLRITKTASNGGNLSPLLNGPPPRGSYCATAGQEAHFSIWVRADPGNAHPGEYGAFIEVSINDANGANTNDEYAPPIGGTNNWIRLSESAWTPVIVGPFIVGAGPQRFDTLFAAALAWVPVLTATHSARSGTAVVGDIFYVAAACWDGVCPSARGAPLQILRTDGLGYSSGPRAIKPGRGDPSHLTIGRTP